MVAQWNLDPNKLIRGINHNQKLAGIDSLGIDCLGSTIQDYPGCLHPRGLLCWWCCYYNWNRDIFIFYIQSYIHKRWRTVKDNYNTTFDTTTPSNNLEFPKV